MSFPDRGPRLGRGLEPPGDPRPAPRPRRGRGRRRRRRTAAEARGLERARAARASRPACSRAADYARPRRRATPRWATGSTRTASTSSCWRASWSCSSPEFVRRFAGRMINVHPSLLPAFPGLDAIEQAIDYGVRVMGVTVHFVDEGVDTGPDHPAGGVRADPYALDVAAIEERVHEIEHELLPRAIRLIAAGAVRVDPATPRRVIDRGRDAQWRRVRARASRSPRPDEVRVRRALLTVSDKRGLVDFARGLRGARRRDRLDRRHRARAPARGHRDPRDRRLHGLPGDPRRARQDAQPAHLRRACWRCARTPSTSRRSRSTGSSRSTSSA